MSGDTVVILAPCTEILETLGLSLPNFSFLNFIPFGCCSLVSLYSKLADEIDLVLFSVFTVSYILVPVEDLDLFDSLILFNGVPLFDSLILGSFIFRLRCLWFVCFQITIHIFDCLFFCSDQWIIGKHDPLLNFL